MALVCESLKSMSEKKFNPIDKHVGIRMRLRRNFLHISQEKLGEKIGVTFQQIQKYEKGLNRIGASRLKVIADALQTDVSYFFADSNGKTDAIAEPDTKFLEFCASHEGIQLMQAFQRIDSYPVRKKIVDLVCCLANSTDFNSDASEQLIRLDLKPDDILHNEAKQDLE